MEVAWPSGSLPLKTQAIRFIAVLFISICTLACALVVTNARMPDPKVARPLPDVLFELFPKVRWLENMTDVCIGFLNMLSALVLFKLYLLHRQSEELNELRLPFQIPFVSKFIFGVWEGSQDTGIERRDVHLIAWIRFVTTYFIILLFRSLVIVMTSYPATDNHCQKPVKITNPVKNIILAVVTFGYGATHCGDLMFSGHTVSVTLGFMIQWVYGPMLHGIFRPVSVILVFLSFYFIIASRSHYTDDILVSFYATAVTFLALRHSPEGAPRQLQLLIGWWPCCGSSRANEGESSNAVLVTVDTPPPEEEYQSTVGVDIKDENAVALARTHMV
ncbi:phosphatidylcholine:ceramide cholinephosphotransferase 2 [Trypanosoma rangeli]|uniref:Phosphatidylcholine:ceramide cholinephosphotransferase 2 n=1 Tax=Trypanosoma rangeli TaxID=5698 RepID=A0A422NCN9_TRYRA|nr:phosphatidylcholine:ceramide cholinephosphotransferase 2 [Trypanosoma rangeli]RNF03248.1 phosphatidylcholine:ceramide cholinephosphotransferase 2 [Trypanosoma rangeli]|eukprot:RNF03248.1 phosphatidylcholine:ceramide cholinephosphotransferase 2 [Trypanosoma rangeli]